MLQFTKQFVTPEIAQGYLKHNTSNRRVKIHLVLRYAKDILNGRWKEDTGEAIKISKSGRVLDGQHRLLAIIKAGIGLWMHVATGIEEDVFDVIDTGSSRNATDVFKIEGIKHENIIPSILSMYNLLKEGRKKGIQLENKSTNAMLLEQYQESPIFWQEVARKSINWYNAFAKILPPSYLGSFYSYFADIAPNQAEQFIDQLATGQDIENNAICLLRTKLMQDKMSARKMPPTLKIALIVKTWNFFRENATVKQLKYDTVKEPYPVAI